jgi:membrane-bound lytic murein transglycosylase F
VNNFARGVPLRTVALALAIAGFLFGCTAQPSAENRIKQRGELRVVTSNSPTSYYLGAQGEEGFEYELARRFAMTMGVKLHMYPVADIRAMQAELASGRADIAAAQLSSGYGWPRMGQVSAPYDEIPQLIVYRKGKPRPHDVSQLATAVLAVRSGSPQEVMLRHIEHTAMVKLHWIAAGPLAADPLEDVANGQADYALVDQREFSFARHLFPDVDVGFALADTRPVHWVVRRGAPGLLSRVDGFFAQLQHSGEIATLARETSGDTHPFEYEESRVFHAHLVERLPRYEFWFAEAAKQTGVDWRLLAAIGYQESKWKPDATSGDGALGVMMLTPDTAAAEGIDNRADPRQNILAGARYFASLRAKIPDRIQEPDRTWLALAAYDTGLGHVEDARIVAQKKGLNPDSWSDVRQALPLLAEERWYTHLKRGYARGWEPVQFVERVQTFLTLLEWQPVETAGATSATGAPPTPGS